MKGVYTHVPSEGPKDAKIVLLGESAWINEVEAGRPFAGQSGNLLKMWWSPLGIKRTEMRLMNLFSYRPPTREIGSVPAEKIIKAIEGIHARIAQLKDPHVIVPCGNYATFALTGKGKVKAQIRNAFGQFTESASEAEKKAGITQLRGSIYKYRDLNGRIVKVIPTIHPAGVLQMPKWGKRSIADWGRIARESKFREVREPAREHIINPSEDDILRFYSQAEVHNENAQMSIDIETWRNTLSCVGFAVSPTLSITIPCTEKDRGNLGWINALCQSACQKVLCNGSYDAYWLNAYGIGIRNYLWDVQSMHHAIDPAESHSLDFLASIYADFYCYWKDEAKEAEEIIKYAKDLDSLYVYNGLDCCYTRELVDKLDVELVREGMKDFYFRHYQAMFGPLIWTMRHGIRVDVGEQKKIAKQLKGELKGLHGKLNELAGEELFAVEEKTALREPTEGEWFELLKGAPPPVEIPKAKYISREARELFKENGLTYMMSGKNAGKIRYKVSKTKKDFSKDKLLEFFYGTLGLPKQFEMRKGVSGKKRTISLNEAALRKLMAKSPKAVEPGGLLLSYREKKKELDYLRGSWDKDGRIRCSYKMNTRAGRLSSAKNPMRKGYNLQNLKR